MSENTYSLNCILRQKMILKQRLWPIALVLLGYFLAYIVMPLVSFAGAAAAKASTVETYRAVARGILLTDNAAILFLTIVFALVLAVQGFAYLHDRRQIDFYESQPQKRSQRFVDRYISGCLIWLAAFTLMTLICFAICGAYGGLTADAWASFGYMYVNQLLMFLAYYSLAVFAVMLTGKVLTSVLGFGMLAVYEAMMQTLIRSCLSQYLDTYFTGVSQVRYWLTPMSNAYRYGQGLLANAVFAVAFTVFAYLLYGKRKNELAGDAVLFEPAKWIIKCMLVLIAAILALFVAECDGGLIAGLLVGALAALVTGCILQIIYEADFRALFKNILPTIIGGAMAFVIFGVIYFDVTGYDDWRPEAGKLASVAVAIDPYTSACLDSGSGVYMFAFAENYMTLTGENAAAVLELIDNKANEGDMMPEAEAIDENSAAAGDGAMQDVGQESVAVYVDLFVCFRMTNGKVVRRVYSVPVAGNQALFEQLTGSEDYKMGAYQAYHDDYILNYSGDEHILEYTYTEDGNRISESIRLNNADYAVLHEAVLSDMEDRSLSELLEQPWICIITVYNSVDGEMSDSSITFDIHAGDTNTIAYLESKGLKISGDDFGWSYDSLVDAYQDME